MHGTLLINIASQLFHKHLLRQDNSKKCYKCPNDGAPNPIVAAMDKIV